MNEIASVRIPKDIDRGFEILAKATDKPKWFHIEKALKKYLYQFRKLQTLCSESDKQNRSESDLAEIDVTVPTKHIYQAQIQKAIAANQRKKSLNTPFFSSSPEDLGYTDASMPDKLIYGDD